MSTNKPETEGGRPKAPDTPECDRLAKVSDTSQTIGEFVDWLFSEKQMDLGRWQRPDGYSEDQFYPWSGTLVNLLAEFFEIDLAKVEAERRAILDYVVKHNQSKG